MKKSIKQKAVANLAIFSLSTARSRLCSSLAVLELSKDYFFNLVTVTLLQAQKKL